MNATQIKSEIQNIDAQIPDLELWHDRQQRARKALVINGDDRDRNILSALEIGAPSGELFTVHTSEARQLLDGWDGRGLRSIDRDLDELRERRDLLEGELPSDKDVAVAEMEAMGLEEQLSDQSKLFTQRWSEFMTALADAERVARKMMAARDETQATVVELSQLRKQYALAIAEPNGFKPCAADSKLAGLLGLLLQNVGHTQEIDRTLEIELASTRNQVEQAAA